MKQELIYFYKSSDSLKNKLTYIWNFKKRLINHIEKEFNGLNIDNPYLHKNDSKYNFVSVNRSITFDSKKIEGYFKFYNDNMFWITNKLVELEVEPRKSLFAFKKFFERDNNIMENQPIESEHLLIELVVEKENCTKENTLFLFDKIKKILNKIIDQMLKENKGFENNNLFKDNHNFYYSKLKAKYPFHNLKDILESYFSENQSIGILFDNLELKSFLDELRFDPIQNDLENTFYFLTYNKNSMSKNWLIKIAERPTIDIIEKQLKFFKLDFENEAMLKEYHNTNVYSYCIDLNLSAIFSALFSDFSIAESSHSPGNNQLEKEYANSKIKII